MLKNQLTRFGGGGVTNLRLSINFVENWMHISLNRPPSSKNKSVEKRSLRVVSTWNLDLIYYSDLTLYSGIVIGVFTPLWILCMAAIPPTIVDYANLRDSKFPENPIFHNIPPSLNVPNYLLHVEFYYGFVLTWNQFGEFLWVP